jgi:hypothetical protein
MQIRSGKKLGADAVHLDLGPRNLVGTGGGLLIALLLVAPSVLGGVVLGCVSLLVLVGVVSALVLVVALILVVLSSLAIRG